MSKKVKLTILFVLVLCLISFNKVYADTGKFLYRDLQINGYDSDRDAYSFTYRVYLQSGEYVETIYVPSSIYNRDIWFLYMGSDGTPQIITYTGNYDLSNGRHIKFKFNYRFGSSARFTWDNDYSALFNFIHYGYVFNNDSWTVYHDNSNSSYTYYLQIKNFQPNGILYTKNVDIIYYKSDSCYCDNYVSLQDDPMIKTTQLGYMPGDGFRLYLNGFSALTDIDDSGETSKTLSNVSFTAYDYNRQCDITSNDDILSRRDVEQDEQGRYYIDILFSDYPSFINTNSSTDTDYLLSFNLNMFSYCHFNVFGDETCFDTTTKFPTTDYFRFRYFADSGVGILVASDENGNEIVYEDDNNNNNNDNENNNSQNFSELTNTISSNTNAINTQTQEIQSMHETSRSILQTIIDLPTNLVNAFLNMLRSLFIPSDDFFTNWLDDLNTYFGDTFGILYYPFELLINFLNKIGNINDTNTAIIHIPAFSLMGETFINEYSYNLNDLLQNETFNNIHTIYLTIVDMILWLGVVFLASKCIRTFIGGMSGEVLSNISINNKGGEE